MSNSESAIIIAVMGVTGAGKSTLISMLMGEGSEAAPVVGHGLESGELCLYHSPSNMRLDD